MKMKIFIQTNEKLIDSTILVVRVTLGIIMFAHGSQKVLGVWGGKGLDVTVAMMSKGLGWPEWLPYLSAFTEFLGGAAMILGVLTRFFGIAILINMTVAVIAVHFKNGFFAPTGFEFPGSLAMSAIAIMLAGPGRFSVDHLLFGGRVKDEKPASNA